MNINNLIAEVIKERKLKEVHTYCFTLHGLKLYDKRGRLLQPHEAYLDGDLYLPDIYLPWQRWVYPKVTQSLKGCPLVVTGMLYCQCAGLTTLQYAPLYIGGDFVCAFNRLKSLDGGPKVVGGHYICEFNDLTTLAGAPDYVGGEFNYKHNKGLKSAS
jgi:hypothetical protein